MRQFQKNEELELSITDIAKSGEGIGHVSGYALFVRDAVIGDRVLTKITKAGKRYGYARLQKVLEPSEDRVKPPCALAGPCGGCQLQAMSYEAQCAYKEGLVRDALTRIGGIENPPLFPIIAADAPLGYRNKAQYPIGVDADGALVAGFYARHSHRIVPIVRFDPEDGSSQVANDGRACLIGKQEDAKILLAILSWMAEADVPPYDEALEGGVIRHILIRHGEASGGIHVCIVANAARLPKEEMLTERLLALSFEESDTSGGQAQQIQGISVNTNREKTNVILGKKTRCIYGSPALYDTLAGCSFMISPASFYQVNHAQTEKIYALAAELADLKGSETVWDLYCGIGTIGLSLAKRAGKLYGIEVVEAAVEDAKKNAAANGIEDARFFHGSAETCYAEILETERRAGRDAKPDVIIVDPPRKGLAPSLIDAMAALAPSRIVYVSCDPATLARDLALLRERGYRIERVQPVDQFPMSVHVECVVLMTRA